MVTLGQRLLDSVCQQHSDYFQCDDERKRPVFITLSELSEDGHARSTTGGFCLSGTLGLAEMCDSGLEF